MHKKSEKSRNHNILCFFGSRNRKASETKYRDYSNDCKISNFQAVIFEKILRIRHENKPNRRRVLKKNNSFLAFDSKIRKSVDDKICHPSDVGLFENSTPDIKNSASESTRLFAYRNRETKPRNTLSEKSTKFSNKAFSHNRKPFRASPFGFPAHALSRNSTSPNFI